MRRPVTVRVVGPTQWIVYPALAVVAATVLLAVPIQLFGLKPPEPVLPLMLAFAWPLIRPSIIAVIVLFGLGLFLDLFWGGALGLWPLALMTVYGAMLLARTFLAGQQTAVRFALYVLAIGLAFLLAYTVVSLSAGNAPSLLALSGQVIPTLLLFPLADWLIQRFDDGDVRFR